MKRFLSFAALTLVLGMMLTSCSNNSPKKVADTFLNGLYHEDYEAAKKVSTDETKKMLDMLQQFSSLTPDSAKKEAQKIKVTIKDVKEEGDKATVTYNTSVVPTDQTLKLIKDKGKWMVQWTKQDQMGGAAPDANMGNEQNMSADTTAPANQQTAPTDTSAAKQ